jgi:hypothetical protein
VAGYTEAHACPWQFPADPEDPEEVQSLLNKEGQEAWLQMCFEGQRLRVRPDVALPIPRSVSRFSSKGITADKPLVHGALALRGRDWLL